MQEKGRGKRYPAKLRPVTIIYEPRRKLLSIVLPNGIRIEGLDAGGVVEMLRCWT